MKIPENMSCHCREMEITETETRLAEKFGLAPADVHRFMDEWQKAAGQVARDRRERTRKNASTPGGNQG